MNAVISRQDQLPGMPEPTSLLQVVERASRDPAVDVAKLKELVLLAREIRKEEAEAAFNDAMSATQAEMGPISQDASNPQTRSKYASYKQLDKALRPIYTKNGFSISYDTGESKKPENVLVLAYVARGGYTRTYQIDMPADGKGAKGGDVMTKTHATMAAVSYGKRGLLKSIFNVAEGEGDTDGNLDEIATLNEDQIANVLALLTEVKADKAKFLHLWRVKAVKDIPQVSYHTVIDLLEAKRK